MPSFTTVILDEILSSLVSKDIIFWYMKFCVSIPFEMLGFFLPIICIHCFQIFDQLFESMLC